jgi:hypothetical protein
LCALGNIQTFDIGDPSAICRTAEVLQGVLGVLIDRDAVAHVCSG